MTWLLQTNLTETLQRTLGDPTLAAQKSVYISSNISATTLNTGRKEFYLGYGLALTGASAVDTITVKNTYIRCMFGVGYGFGIAGTISSSLTAFNLSVGLAPFAIISFATGTACFWIGRKVNSLTIVGAIPAI